MTRSRNSPRRPLLAMAIAIRNNVVRANERNSECPSLSADDLFRLNQLTRQIHAAKRRGWKRAAARLARKLPGLVRFVDQQLHLWLAQRETSQIPIGLPSGTHLVRELTALEAEFGTVECDFEATELFVTTERIVLEEIDLGRFEIRLNWTQTFDGARPLRIVARDPNPAAESDHVTHPHVREESLCLGDGRRSVGRALETWQLFDFFVIVNQILLTYSKERAFVSLSEWNDSGRCGDCGSPPDEDSIFHCQRCGTTLCDNCVTLCDGCSQEFCSQCSTTCDHCHRYRCSSCLVTCAQCQATVCSDCREHETLCTKCHEQTQSEDDSSFEPVARSSGHLRQSIPARAAV